jgi:hypothetical protein
VVVKHLLNDVLYWECMGCGTRMHRWPQDTLNRRKALRYLEQTYGADSLRA